MHASWRTLQVYIGTLTHFNWAWEIVWKIPRKYVQTHSINSSHGVLILFITIK